MPKFKGLLPNVFNKTNKTNTAEGRLETDAQPVEEVDDDNNALNVVNNTPRASVEFPELPGSNYNSMEITHVDRPAALVDANSNGVAVVPGSYAVANDFTTNTMNNAQQQVVMQFSNSNNLHFGSVYNFNLNGEKGKCNNPDNTNRTGPNGLVSQGSKRQTPRKTATILAMMQSNEELNHRMLSTIATHLGVGWKEVMRELGLSEGQIEQNIINHMIQGKTKEVIYQLLLEWQNNADDGIANLGHITTLLWKLNHRECVQRMKLEWKDMQKTVS